jgi:hypothetical protein
MKTYYIVFETDSGKHCRLKDTENNLDTLLGLIKEMADIEAEMSKKIIVYFWKEFTKN